MAFVMKTESNVGLNKWLTRAQNSESLFIECLCFQYVFIKKKDTTVLQMNEKFWVDIIINSFKMLFL